MTERPIRDGTEVLGYVSDELLDARPVSAAEQFSPVLLSAASAAAEHRFGGILLFKPRPGHRSQHSNQQVQLEWDISRLRLPV